MPRTNVALGECGEADGNNSKLIGLLISFWNEFWYLQASIAFDNFFLSIFSYILIPGYCDANFVCGLGCPEVDLFEGSAYDMQVYCTVV